MTKKAPQNAIARRRPGRPPGLPGAVRRNRVVTMVTDTELEKLSILAGNDNRSLSSLVHQILAQYLDRRK